MNILIVEDNKDIAAVISECLVRLGHRVVSVHSGLTALYEMIQMQFDLILLDIYLPDARGDELIPNLKALDPDIGIVTMTGCNSRELELKIREQGILYYMIKPFRLEELEQVLDRISQPPKTVHIPLPRDNGMTSHILN